MSIQLPDGSVVSNWSPGWEKNLPKWYTDGYESGLFNESNNWGRDFFPQTTHRGPITKPPVIKGGPSMVPGYPSRQTSPSFPSLDGKIENFLRNLPKAPGLPEERRTTGGSGYADFQPDPTFTGGVDPTIVQGGPVPPEMIPRIDTWPTSLPRGRTNQAPRPEGLQRAITGLADYITGNKWDFDQRGRGGIPRGRGQYEPMLPTTFRDDPITFDNPRITQGPARIDDTPIRYPNNGFWDQVVPMKDGGSIQRLPLDPPSSNRRKGLPTGIKPSDMSWEDWYGQWGMKPLPGRISRDESPWGSNWEGSIKYL